MRKTLDQILREHPLLQTYLALGGTYHFDSRDIVLNTPGCEEEAYSIGFFRTLEDAESIDIALFIPINMHIYYMEEQLQRQQEYEQQVYNARLEEDLEEEALDNWRKRRAKILLDNNTE